VFVVDAQNRARRTPVVIGDRAGDMVMIKAGLPPGARVALGGAAFLQDGDLVRPVEQGADQNAATNAKKGG
jgi:HlyD family secretion protein